MSKESYKVPTSLDRHFMDHELNLFAGTSVPIKVPAFFLLSALTLFWIASSTFIAHGAWWIIPLFVIWWIVASIMMGSFTKTREFRFMQVPSVLAYLPSRSRRVITRSAANASNFKSIVGIKDISEDGLVQYENGAVGQAYMVVGSASVLLFDQDEAAIINRVDDFWRKVDTSSDFITLTKKEPQRVETQIANLKRRYDALDLESEELRDIMEHQLLILRDYVGEQFKSIHQYILVRSDGMEALRAAHTALVSERNESDLMFKALSKLDRKATLDALNVFYHTRETV